MYKNHLSDIYLTVLGMSLPYGVWRTITWCGPLYGGCRVRCTVSCHRKVWVESWRSLWTKVAGDE